MVNGLDLFRTHFRAFPDRYALIGGTACEVLFTDAGVDFRSTKDIDIVLCIETIDAAFATTFWEFVADGGYDSREASSGKRRFYRFSKPKRTEYPAMLELFARAPDALAPVRGHLTPIPIADEVSSLSAILLDDVWYAWIREGIGIVNELPVVGTAHLIALKAKAWNDLRARRESGEPVDRQDVKKHRNDIFRLLALLDPGASLASPDAVRREMALFLAEVVGDPPAELKRLGLGDMTLARALEALRVTFQLA